MRSPASLLLHRTAASSGETSSPLPLQPPASMEQRTAAPAAMADDSDMVVILASLLCALVCVLGLGLGLALLSRCWCRRRRSASSSSDPLPKGLKKKAINALPTVSFAASPESSPPAAAAWSSSSECTICLAEFADGESVRVLPRCGHGFHVACVDGWLRTRATCPSCRAAIVALEPTKPAPAHTTEPTKPASWRRWWSSWWRAAAVLTRICTMLLSAFSDADWAGSSDDRRSTEGYAIF